jgi:hypothetical protein
VAKESKEYIRVSLVQTRLSLEQTRWQNRSSALEDKWTWSDEREKKGSGIFDAVDGLKGTDDKRFVMSFLRPGVRRGLINPSRDFRVTERKECLAVCS